MTLFIIVLHLLGVSLQNSEKEKCSSVLAAFISYCPNDNTRKLHHLTVMQPLQTKTFLPHQDITLQNLTMYMVYPYSASQHTLWQPVRMFTGIHICMFHIPS